jgi:hypothetical protein
VTPGLATGGLLGRAGSDVLHAPRLWAIALAGFLASGGIVLFALPIVVLPSVVGMSTFIGPNAVTAAGPSTRFIELVTVSVLVAIVWIVLGTLISVAAERELVRAVVDPRAIRASDPRLGQLLVLRLVSLVPFGVALALAGSRLGQVGYQELILPTSSSAPFVVRVLLATPDAIALIALGWLLSELVGSIGIRLAMVEGRGTMGSIGASLRWTVRRPLRAIGLLAATGLAGVLVIGPAVALSVAAWSAARASLLSPTSTVVGALEILLFVTIWTAGLALAGIVAAWRSAAWSLAVVEDHRVGGPTTGAGGTL